MPSTNRDNFAFFFLSEMLFISPFCLITLAGITRATLSRNDRMHLYLAPDFRRVTFNPSPLNILAIGWSYLACIMLRYRLPRCC